MKHIYNILLCVFPIFVIAQNNSIYSIIDNNQNITIDYLVLNNSSATKTTLQQDKIDRVRKNAFKIHSMLFNGSVALSYERSISRKISTEIGFGYIYTLPLYRTTRDYGTTRGFMLRGGLKYLFLSDKSTTSQILDGPYLMPEFFYTSFCTKDGYQKIGITENFESYAITLNFGYQHVFKNGFLINVFLGGGIGKSMGDYNQIHYYNHIIFSDNLSFALTTGLKLGFAF
ncbi:MAG: hypothetical protein DRI84_09145 [Bacteroidetes bacterium]|nr:MAG: hypothetical protein DRI84_09145 [Bacteroidota bacterium]